MKTNKMKLFKNILQKTLTVMLLAAPVFLFALLGLNETGLNYDSSNELTLASTALGRGCRRQP